jgi:RimJ/RimL family protein N-acetyltransferase
MPSPTCHLPNGQTFSVTPVFGGVTFKSNDMNIHHSAFPPGWTVIIHTEETEDDPERHESSYDSPNDSESNVKSPSAAASSPPDAGAPERKVRIHRFKRPTLRNDCLFISGISNPSSDDFKSPSSPSRQIAMMLWATLYWYFHEPEPNLYLTTEASANTPMTGRPKGDWRVNIKREGIFKGRNLMQKLERMGLISHEDSSVGIESLETRNPAGWERMFTSRRSFWQLDPRIFVFTLNPASASPAILHSPSLSPFNSRPSSPSADSLPVLDGTALSPGESILHTSSVSGGPYASGSHLPTYYPPAPTQYTFTDGIRHPIRQRPPHQGETFYMRYIPSVGQYLSFRVPVLTPPKAWIPGHLQAQSSVYSLAVPRTNSPPPGPSDLDLLHKWMNDPRVNASWGEAGPRSKQENFLRQGLTSRHSFPVFGCWDGKPFGYFEIYWVKEDRLGRLLAGNVGNYDRGLHVLVGEQEFRGAHRVAIWLSALVHYCWLADMRTETVLLEPRVDNEK